MLNLVSLVSQMSKFENDLKYIMDPCSSNRHVSCKCSYTWTTIVQVFHPPLKCHQSQFALWLLLLLCQQKFPGKTIINAQSSKLHIATKVIYLFAGLILNLQMQLGCHNVRPWMDNISSDGTCEC